jgi:two-component system sensor histidine kinase ChiS
MVGTAAGVLMFCSLIRLWIYGGFDRLQTRIPSGEYRCRIAALWSVLCSALALAFPRIPGFEKPGMLIASLMELAGLLGFGISLTALFLLHCFPGWKSKQFLPLLLLGLLTALLPLSRLLSAPFALGCFSLALCSLHLVLPVYLVKLRPPQSPPPAEHSPPRGQIQAPQWFLLGKPFLYSALIYLFMGLSFVLPRDWGTFLWPAALLGYVLLEHRLFLAQPAAAYHALFLPPAVPAGVETAKFRDVPAPVPAAPISAAAAVTPVATVPADTVIAEAGTTGTAAENPEPEDADAEPVEELAELEDVETKDTASAGIMGIVPAGKPPAELPGTPSVGSFIPREFLAILNKKSVAELKLGDHIKQEMTIFFSDIRRFTDLSENLTPEESFAFINSYLSRIVPEITKTGGFVDKYIGDAILALFPQVNGPDMAVRTAIAIQERILESNIHRAKCGYRPLAMGIGIHTGTLMLGVVGTKDRMQNTVISDAVNLASRVESLTKAFQVSLAISEETFKKLEDPGAYQYRFVGKVRVKGKVEPVSIFEIFDGIDEKLQRKKIEANRFFEQGMFMYYQKKYSEALQEFGKVLEVLPDDGAAAFYIDNCMTKIKI